MIIDNNGKNIFATNTVNNNVNNATKGRVDNNPSAAKGAGEAKAAATTRPEVSLSSQAQRLSQLESNIQSAPAVDSQRVAEIKLALANGTYEINAERIASRMLDQDRLF